MIIPNNYIPMDIFAEPTVPHVSADEVKKALDSGEQAVVLDVRTAGEYMRAHIEGSINVSLDMVECDIRKKIPDVSTKIYVYCLSGSRSAHAVDRMIMLGYTNVYDMQYGLLGWRAKYFPLVS